MGTTPAFGLRYPGTTDKVTDGALAIRNLAEDVDADLGAEVTRANAAYVANALADAKGDLLAASGPDAVARLGVGADGQVLTADAAAALGVKWAPLPSGGLTAPTSTVATSQSTTSTAFTNLATIGPVVTMTTPSSGSVFVVLTHDVGQSTSGQVSFAGFEVSGGTARAASTTQSLILVAAIAGQGGQFSGVFRVDGLAAGVSHTFTAKYRVSGGTGTFANRQLSVIPIAA